MRRLEEASTPAVFVGQPFDQSLRYSPARRNRPDVILTVRILHREGFDRPVDDCQDRCLKEMEQRLRELGASRKTWAPRKS